MLFFILTLIRYQKCERTLSKYHSANQLVFEFCRGLRYLTKVNIFMVLIFRSRCIDGEPAGVRELDRGPDAQSRWDHLGIADQVRIHFIRLRNIHIFKIYYIDYVFFSFNLINCNHLVTPLLWKFSATALSWFTARRFAAWLPCSAVSCTEKMSISRP